ncbi:MAG: methylmalonyl-CoA carboxyltransferase [Bacteroidales bacterium]|jgi:propionyl-CoA carboxylase beta chain|nr:methylmalonyl-CoA carboxyltransferase [Bacteroidales bacterium]OQB64838.1 MAG: putative propionyl-CoA carboxylase beta chain 5 [Bacteroidetes bacterium ADurb.Bin145]HOU02055.1 acyl-CoA carboxylase subunit beta [Bacteroidales bacterium]HQK66797.1 acyl-CoA carboxylase subunit beta [Bacteroidales bacterium]
MDISGKSYKAFLKRQEALQKQYSEKQAEKQHAKGKLTARERIRLLFDQGTFEEIDAFVTPADQPVEFGKVERTYGDGVIVGHGKVNGRLIFAFAQDFTIMGGSLGVVHAKKIAKIQEMALKMGCPIIGMMDSGGARIQEGVASLSGYASIFHNIIQSSGIIPQISVIMGPAAGGAVYSPALTDFVFMVNNTSYMFVTGPNVVKEVLNEDVTFDELGGAETHARKSGVAHMIYDDEENTIMALKKFLTYLPSNNVENPPVVQDDNSTPEINEKLRDIVPDDPNKAYDVKDVINLIVDKNSFYETAELFAPNLVTGLARLKGKTIGVVANQPKVLAGVLDIDSSTKGARFIRFCDAFNIPILTLEDVPGFLPGVDQEHAGIIRHGAKLLFAYSEATVPRITIILRKAYGGAFIVMNSKSLGGDFSFAWPTAEIAVMGPDGAVAILYRKELAESSNPAELKKELVKKYRDKIANPFIADESGYIDEVIDPAVTRKKIISALNALSNKWVKVPARKHGNMPL